VGFALNNMGSAQLDSLAFEEPAAAETNAARPEVLDLKQQVAARLAAHRERRSRGITHAQPAPTPSRSRNNPIAAAVAERYAHTPSYRAFLAEQAQRAMEQATRDAEQAAAEAEVAARNAQAVAAAQQQLLAELELWKAPQQFTPETAQTISSNSASTVEAAPAPVPSPKPRRSAARQHDPKQAPAAPVREVSSGGLTVRLYEDLGRIARSLGKSTTNEARLSDVNDAAESASLDQEIAFRQSPVFEPFSLDPPTPLPANLLEFPRQLVAVRKARPRLAEGPLREESESPSPQLRIFEVEAEQISTIPESPSVTPEWANIRLDAQPEPAPAAAPANEAVPALSPSLFPPQTAPLELRAMAFCVDLLLNASALLLCIGLVARFVHSLPTGIPALLAAAGSLAVFFLLYEFLFFTFSDQTPGMAYARLGFCTLADENPTRPQIRRRIVAQLIALCPLGLGFLWALLDDDGLGWHDRISRMYQRSY
jgi:uncharacterized RDD family membrane protein YckC